MTLLETAGAGARARATAHLGLVALAGWSLHAAVVVARHHPENLLWSCHVATLGVALGLLTGSPRVLAPAAFLALLGAVTWPIDVVVTGEIEPTSAVSHVTGIALGLAGLRRLGLPRGTWLRAAAFLLGLHVLSRFVTPPAENVNLAFAVHASLSRVVRSHALYITGVTVAVTLGFRLLERALRLLGVRAIDAPRAPG